MGVGTKLRRLVRTVGYRRALATAAFLLAALLLARWSWELPFTPAAERALYDLRVVSTAPRVDKDERMVMIVYNDDTLIATRKRSPLDRATLARALRNIDAMGAKAIGIDILIDQEQDEDGQLVEAFKAMRTPTWLAYASTSSNAEDIQYRQQEFLDAFQKSIAGPKVHPTSIRLEVDSDNVVRSWPTQPRNLPPLLATALAPAHAEFRDYTGSIRFTTPRLADYPVYDKLPIDLFAGETVVPQFADLVRGRYVLIGGDIIDFDEYETPLRSLSGTTTIGLEVHAQMLSQLLDGARFKPIPGWALWISAAIAVMLGALSSLKGGAWWRIAGAFLVQAGIAAWAPFALQARMVDTHGLPVFGWALAWVIAFAAVGAAARSVGSEQRRYAQSALGKYLPRDIAAEILENPESLALHGEKREIFVVFTDLEGFTKLSHAIAPEMVATLLNRYLDMLSDVVLEHGGTIDKFVGDAVVAFWGAPISRPDDGERAARAAYAMWRAGESFRAQVPEGVPPIGKTRVGLHFGEAIVGNFGGEGRIQYTALGDSMNTAARLEAANKTLHSSIMASREAMERSGLDWWRPMGRITLRGRATPVDIFEPVPDMPEADRLAMREIVRRIDDGETAALNDLKVFAAQRADDAALDNLVYRLHSIKTGGSYVLD
ncbi:MAG TPA: adenylate/guanylate cyclase domain-containing protein [Novosphingobium sp.]